MHSTITATELHRRMAAGEPLNLLDVRTPAEFAARHARGAHLVPLDQLDPVAVNQRVDGGPVFFICQSGKRATMAAERLARVGCANAIVVDGGTEAWAAAGLPCESSGGKVVPLERQVRIAAGAIVLIGALLGWFVNPLFAWLSAFVGAGLMFSGITDTCAMGMLMARMPWNRAK
ncbi:MAG: rhodanese-like domain-containing protein [Chthoniobacteraceae bacterium]